MHFKQHVTQAWFLMVVLAMALLGRSSRPTDAVLNPNLIAPLKTLLAATNRARSKDGISFESIWAGNVAYSRYEVSVPDGRDSTTISYPTVKPDARWQFVITRRDDLSPDQFVTAAVGATAFDDTVAVFVQGYNYSYQEALFRMAQMAADANPGGAPILKPAT